MNIEEKAKEYVNELYMQTTHLFKERCIAREGYLSGYTQAATDLSAENEKLKFESQNYADLFRASQEVVNQYKEALRELVKEAEGYVIPDADKANNSQYDNYIEIDDFKSLVTKAKQLITEEK